MIAIYDYKQELREVFDSFQHHVNQPYLTKFIKEPECDEDQATILLIMLKQKGLSDKYTHDCILTTMLVQAALDTHEAVNIHGLGTEELRTERQLTVLAGDYYSSLYYFVLSKLEDVSLIRVFAKSIQDINESKMNIYKQNKKIDQLAIRELKNIYGSLLTNLANFLNFNDENEQIAEFFLMKNLLIDRFQFSESGFQGMALNFFQQKNYQEPLNSNEKYLIGKFNTYIELSRTKLNINQSTQAKSELDTYINLRTKTLVQEYQSSEKYAVEEG